MKTITFDEYIYKLIPIEITDEMTDAACDAGNLFRVDFDRAYDAALEAVPADLPGVVAHSGEPCGWVHPCLLTHPSWSCATMGQNESADDAVPLFTHPPAQPDTTALDLNDHIEIAMLEDRVAELEAQIAAQAVQQHSEFGSPELQAMIVARATEKDRELAIVQAALEAAAAIGDDAAESRHNNDDERRSYEIYAEEIRTIDPQSTIDGMTK